MNKILLTLAAAAAMSMSVSAAENVIFSAYDGNGGTLFGWGGGTMENVDEGGKPCFKFANTEAKQGWEIQACIETPLTDGETYHLSFDVKGDAATGIGVALQKSDGYADRGSLGAFDVTPEWKSVTLSGAVNGEGCDRVLYNLGTYVGTLYMTNIKLYTEGNGGDTPEQPEQPKGEVIASSDFTTMASYNMWKADVVDVKVENGALVVTNSAATAEFWDFQYFVADGFSLVGGQEYTITAKIKGFKGNLHLNMGTWSDNVMGDIVVEEAADWQTVSGTLTAKADANGDAHLMFQTGDFVGTYEVASVVITKGATTGVDAVEVAPVVNHWTVYNLMGVKVLDTDNEAAVNELANGIYVINGKKVAIRK